MDFKDSFGSPPAKVIHRADTFAPEDYVIEKIAGIDIYEPTIDNIEHFIREYLGQNLYFIGKQLPINVNLIPNSFNSTKPEFIDDAAGIASFNYQGATIELPFIIYGGELVPFDVIQLGNQRVPYSQENMKKIIKGIIQAKQDNVGGTANGKDIRGYIGISKPVNPSSSIGFLGSVMSIQDQYIGKGDPRHIYAAENVIDGLEKIANLKPVDENVILALLEKAAKESMTLDFEKIAREDTDALKGLEKTMSKIASVDWKNAATLKNGTFIMIPELKTSTELSITPELTMTPAIVIDNFIDFGFENPKGKVVITSDRRIKILKNGEHMVCFVSEKPTFKLPTTDIYSVEEGNVIMAFNGNGAMYPQKVVETKLRNWLSSVEDYDCNSDTSVMRAKRTNSNNHNKNEVGKVFKLNPIGINNQASAFIAGSDNELDFEDKSFSEIEFNIATLHGMKFSKVTYQEFLSAKEDETGVPSNILENLVSNHSLRTTSRKKGSPNDHGVIVTDPSTKVIIVKGVISDYLTNVREIENFADSGELMLKSASSSEFVEVRTRDKWGNTLDLKLVYTDRSKRIFSQQVKNFDNLEEYKARGILRAIGFDQAKCAEIIAKAKKDQFSRMDLPANATPDTVSGASPKSVAEDKFIKIKDIVFSPEVKSDLAVSLTATLLGDIGSSANKAIKGIIDINNADIARNTARSIDMQKTSSYNGLSGKEIKAISDKMLTHAKKAAAASSVFEKLAMSIKSDSFREVAYATALSSNLISKTAEIITNDKFYEIESIAKDIKNGQSYFEKMAFDLTAFKMDQHLDQNFIVNNDHIQQAVRSLDDLVKTANSIIEVCNKGSKI